MHDTDIDGHTRVNGEETARARLKAEDMQQRWADWVWNDPDRTQALTEAFNERFNSHVLRSTTAPSCASPAWPRARLRCAATSGTARCG